MAVTSPVLPSPLIEAVARGRCVLFLGADASYSTPNWIAPPTRAELAAALAAAYPWVPATEAEITQAATAFLTQGPGTRETLAAFVQEQVARATRPGLLHQHIVNLGFDVIVSAAYDDLTEQAMQEAGRHVFQVVGNAEIAYAGKEGEAVLTRLAGTVSQPDSLMLTHDDQLHVEAHLAERLQAARGWCAQRALLFIGWDPADPRLERLYLAATEALKRDHCPDAIIWPDPTPQAVEAWSRRNVTLIPTDPLRFLQIMRRQVRLLSPPQPEAPAAHIVTKMPYKFLNYFEPEDQDIFYGREIEAALVARMALSYPLLTLFGKSGVGKASLLRAGVVPQLLAEGYTYTYVRALGDPLEAIREGVCRALGLDTCPKGPLRTFFRRALGETGRMVVILDQFEELFIRSSTQTRARFWKELGECVRSLTSPEVHFILSLREGYLAELDEARRPLKPGEPAPIPTILHHSYRLQSLDADSACRAMVEPARRANCTVDPRLVDVLLGRMAMPGLPEQPASDEPYRAWSLAETDEIIPLPQLQIVMDRLYRHALAAAGCQPPADEEIARGWTPPALDLTLEHYRALGGAGKILADYVTEALDRIPSMGGSREMAVSLLKMLVTSKATKAVLDENEMITHMVESDPDFDPDDAAALRHFQVTRDALVVLRLVRRFREHGQAFYELAHGHVAAEVATWVGQEEMRTKLARELLRRELGSWRTLNRLIDPAAFRLIDQHREGLRRLTDEEQELLFRSAAAAGHEVLYWREQAPAAAGRVEQELCQKLGTDDPDKAEEASRMLLTLDGPSVIARLAALVEEEFTAAPVMWVDHTGKEQALRRTVLNLTTDRQRRALSVLTRMMHPEAAAVLCRWTPPGMLLIPAGSFTLGDTWHENESPVHTLWLGAFWIDRYPVTHAQWAAFLAADPWQQEALWTEAGLDWKEKREDQEPADWEAYRAQPTHPVRSICWYEALAYARWAGKTLPSEAQWEKAARGPQGHAYPWGETLEREQWNDGKSRQGTVPVDYDSPAWDSAYGVACMAGNIWEWCRDLYIPYPYDPDDGRAVLEGTGLRVVRGCSYYCDEDSARAASRRYSFPHAQSDVCGVRVGITETLNG